MDEVTKQRAWLGPVYGDAHHNTLNGGEGDYVLYEEDNVSTDKQNTGQKPAYYLISQELVYNGQQNNKKPYTVTVLPANTGVDLGSFLPDPKLQASNLGCRPIQAPKTWPTDQQSLGLIVK